MSDVLSLSMENKFSFNCPVMSATVEMRSCVYLRTLVFRGEARSTRRGCQACITSSKCPAAEMVRRFAFNTNDATDHCGSVEPKLGRIPGDVLERIAAVVVTDQAFAKYSVTEEERALITGSRNRIEEQIASAPRERVSARRIAVSDAGHPRTAHRKTAERASAPETTTDTNINKAAATGDLAASLNAA